MDGSAITWICLICILGAVQCQSTIFQSVIDDFWSWRMQNNPEFASNVGNHEYDDLLEDYSLSAFETRKAEIEALLLRTEAINRNSLTPSEKVTYDVLKDTLAFWIESYRWRYYGPMNGISFLDGIQTNHGSRAGQLKFTTEKDFRNFAERIYKYGHQINQTMARMDKAIEMGTTLNNVSMSRVPGQLDVMLAYKNDETSFSFYAPFKDGGIMDELVANNSMSAQNRSEIRQKAIAGITYFLNQIERLKTYVVNTYMPNTRANLGVFNLTDGAMYYKACLKWHLSVDLTPDQIHEKGLQEVSRIRGLIETIMQKEEGFQGDFKAYLEYLRNSQQFYLASKEEILQRLHDILDNRITPKLASYFKNIPDFELKIAEMTYDGPAGIYKNGAIDGSRPGTYYANVMDLKNNPTYGIPALLLHESDPGHHLQDGFALTSPNIPDFRKVTDFSKYFAAPLHFPFYTAYSEGWAMYSEDLGEELGIYVNDHERVGKYMSEIFRAARLVVDTGIHAKGWTKEMAVDYFVNNTASSKASLEKEVDRYSTWPGQATSYMIGKIKFQELRTKAMRELCSHFDIKGFHAVVLENGAMPLSVMENLVDKWISDVKANAGVDDVCQTAGARGVAEGSQLIILCIGAVIFNLFSMINLF